MRIVEFKSIQANTFRILFEALKEILIDVNIEFSASGMRIVQIDTAKTTMVEMELQADKFEMYNCTKTVNIGVNIINLFKIIKTCSNANTLHIFYDDEEDGVLNIIINNEEKNITTTYQLNLIETNQTALKPLVKEYESVIFIPTVDMQKMIKDMNQFSEKLDIKCRQDELTFSCVCDFTTRQTTIRSNELNSTISFEKESKNIIQGIYNIKHLVAFIKCTSLCSCLKMYLANDYPMTIEYYIGNLGNIKFIVAPYSDM